VTASQQGAAHFAARTQQARGTGGATRIEVTLDGLRQLLDRIDHEQVEREDWPLLRSLVWNELLGKERRQERAIAKVLAAAKTEHDASGRGLDAEASSPSDEATESPRSSGTNETSHSELSDAKASDTEPAPPAREAVETTPGDSKKPKGHGRNGARAYRQARHFSHGLAPGVIGALCEACGLGKMYRYREKIVIRIVGQPLFGAESHHHEQARCRRCGRIVRAQGPACVHEGLGTDYIRYDWSACAMLLVMHYFGGAPFKRLESLHEGWGVPMPDANQWQVVSAGDDLLLPLYKALEQHAIEKATNFRIDDTGSMVIAIQKQIDAELAALESIGKSTRDVRTGINATGLYWETPNGPVILFYTGRNQAGEVVDRVLRHRLLSSPKLVKCTDGASKNFDHGHAAQLVESTCNAHAFLKFRAIKDKYPVEYAEAGRVYQKVFDHDDEAKVLGLSPVDRMLHHRKHSKPLLEQLKKMCEEKITSR
jgi:ribosomal protein L37E